MESTDQSPELQLATADATVIARPPKGLWRETLERLLRKPSAVIGLAILGCLVFIAIFAPLIATHDPLQVLLDIPEEGIGKRDKPCIHLFGCPGAGDNLFEATAPSTIQSAALSATNSLISVISGNTITIWSLGSGKKLMDLEAEQPILAIDWSPNDQKILSVTQDELIVWDVNRRQIDRALENPGGATRVKWNADGTRFLTANATTVHLWDTLSWNIVSTIDLESPLTDVAWNGNGTLVMTASGKQVQLWNVFTGTVVTTLEHDNPVTSARFNRGSTRIVTTAGTSLHVWNAASFAEERVIEYGQPLDNASWNEDISRGVDRVMATSGDIGLVWNTRTGELILELDHEAPIERIASSPLATRIFTKSEHLLRVWDATNGERILSEETDGALTTAAWQTNGGGVLLADGNKVHVVKTSDRQYLMGIDGNVRDQFSRVIYGTRLSLMVGLVTVSLAVIVGTISGAVAGFVGGWVDNVIMRIMDVMLAFPSLILAIAVVTVLGPGLINALTAISIVFIPAYARVARSGVLAVKEEDFVIADRALGVSSTRILFHRVLPNALAPLIVQATLGIGTAILDAAALSFLGLGAQPPTPEWGAMLGAERNQVFTAPHLVFYPGIAIMITVLAFNLLGDGLRDALDPRLDR